MKRSCTWCGKMHEVGYQCSAKPIYQPKKRAVKKDECAKFRRTLAWKKKAVEIKERDKWCCVVCRKEGRYNCNNLEVHHITKIRDNMDIALDNDNLITLCITHHRMADEGEIDADVLRELVKK